MCNNTACGGIREPNAVAFSSNYCERSEPLVCRIARAVYIYVTGSAKTCQDARIFENQFLAFYNSLVHGDYNALCFTFVACSVAKLRAPPFPCSAEERLE